MYNCIVRISGFLLSNYLSDNSIAHSTQVIHEFRNFCNTNNGISNSFFVATVSEGTLKYRDSTAKLGVSYYYTVKACAGDVTSDYVKNVKGTAVPSAPTVKTAGSTKGVTVTWTGSKASANSYATGYRVFRKTAGGSWKTVGTVGKDTRSFTDTTGAKGTTYYYTVRAYVKQSDGSNLWGSYNTAGVAGTRK